MTSLASGHTAIRVEGEELARHVKGFPNAEKDGLVRLSPGGWLYQLGFTAFADRLFNFKYVESDVVVMTFPKCGTTWTQEIVWTMKNNPDLDNPYAEHPMADRVPFIESDMFRKGKDDDSQFPPPRAFQELCPDADPTKGVSIQLAEAVPHPRTIKTHLPFSLMPPDLLNDTKVVYVVRNPKDVAISYLHHFRLSMRHKFTDSLDTFVDFLINDDVLFCPYWLHVRDAWERRDHPNLHFIFYEDLKKDNMDELRKLDAFLGTQLSEEQLNNVAKHTSFSAMKTRDNLLADKGKMKDSTLVDKEELEKEGGFFRKGEIGDWKNRMSPESSAKIDQWIKDKFNFGFEFK